MSEVTGIQSTYGIEWQETPRVGSIAKSEWHGGKIEHYSIVVGVFDEHVYVMECNVPKLHEGGCGMRLLGSSVNEEIVGYSL